MSQKLTDRNRLIAKLYGAGDQSGAELARRFDLSPGRISQIVDEYGEITMMTKEKKTAHIPKVMIEPSKEQAVRTIADEMGVNLSVVVRWGVDAMIEKYAHLLTTKPS